ncbi:MAG: hypothetical protein AAF802_04775 [Planctomycetota bacterium]
MNTQLKIKALLLLGLLVVYSAGFGDEPRSKRSSTDHLYPAELEFWKNAEGELVSGIVKAEKLRSRLLAPTAKRLTGCQAVADLVAEAQKSLRWTDEQPKKLRHSIAAFDVSSERLLTQIRGDAGISPQVFDAFDGRWFGKWDTTNVNHDWRPSIVFSPPRTVAKRPSSAKDQPTLAALQYPWISNGFGWNYLLKRNGDSTGNYVLGMVFYFAPPNYRDITEEKPHVGFADGPTRLVWITEYELYLEEAFPASSTGKPDYYVTTGFRHDLFGENPSVEPECVQATYTRDPNDRPSFQKVTWNAKAVHASGSK